MAKLYAAVLVGDDVTHTQQTGDVTENKHTCRYENAKEMVGENENLLEVRQVSCQ